MRRVSFLFLIWVALVACFPKATSPSELPLTSGPQITPAPSPTSGDIFEIEAWVDNATPNQNSRVTVSGSLIKNGVRLGGMMMQATWPDKTQERGLPNCNVLVIYGSGVCAIDISNYSPAVFVPITVTFKYGGITHIGHTGFTPQ